jgi:predicted Rossmann fold nucleotide-binding protein DprA/Smf involved in DNA uptake
VLAHGLDHLAPARHRQLAREIVQSGGALVSALQDHEVPLPARFPERNRWIAGMCQHVVVVEAGVRSGALGTARHAVEQGRGLHTIPWGLAHPVAQGCHRLLVAGSGVVSDVEQFVGEITGEPPVVHPQWLKRVFDGVALEQIAQETGRSFGWVLGELGARVARGEVERLPGQRYAPAGPIRMHRGQDDFGDSTR